MTEAWRVHLFWCICSTAFGVSLNKAIVAWAPRSWMRDVWGTPWYSWRIGSLHQALVFPPLCVAATLAWTRTAAEATATAYLHSELSEHEGSPCHLAFHYMFWGYLMKDMFIDMEMVLYLHHVLCLVLCTMSMAGWEKGDFFLTFRGSYLGQFRSFRLIFGREIISRRVLEEWTLSSTHFIAKLTS